MGLVSTGSDGEIHYLNTGSSGGQNQGAAAPQLSQPALITLPITMPGAKPGDAQQTVQIQVVNPNSLHAGHAAHHQHHQAQQQQQQQPPSSQQASKIQMGQMQIPIQNFQQGTTVLTVAYANQDGDLIQNHGLPEGMTVVAALQPQDLHLLAAFNTQHLHNQQQQQQQQQQSNEDSEKDHTIK